MVFQPRTSPAIGLLTTEIGGPLTANWFAALFENVVKRVETHVVGANEQVRLAVACLLCGGHLLLEGLPGVGKTSLASGITDAVAELFPTRIQGTPDLLPSDITGTHIFLRTQERMIFQKGPIFANVVLFDEINRAAPRTQSALLEAMQERRVTALGETFTLPEPFFVVATQNPSSMVGTFPLPEAQVDRFLMRLTLGYPDEAAELSILRGLRSHLTGGTARGGAAPVQLARDELLMMRRFAQGVMVRDNVLGYLVALLHASRSRGLSPVGASPRAGLALLAAARVWAAANRRDEVLPDDIRTLAPHVLAHRLVPDSSVENPYSDQEVTHLAQLNLVEELLSVVPTPKRP